MLFNLSISTGRFPSYWKSSFVVPVPKTKPPSISPADYRPISLLSVVSKLLERHVHSLLSSHLNEQGLLSSSQWALCRVLPQLSLLPFTLSLIELVEKGYDMHMALLFFNLKKAFDTVPHLQLLETTNLCGKQYIHG